MNFKRVFIEKKKDFNTEARLLKKDLKDLKDYLRLDTLNDVRIINIYDLVNAGDEEKDLIVENVLFEPAVDNKFEDIEFGEDEKYFRTSFLEGQYNQREDSANKLIDFIIEDENIYISHTKLFLFKGVNEEDLEKIKKYYINPVEKREVKLEELIERKKFVKEDDVEVIDGFMEMDMDQLNSFKDQYGIGMDLEDIEFCQRYFKEDERRNPTIVELKLIDTYWSDHCRHTTFMTEIEEIEIEEGRYEKVFQNALNNYINSREYVFGESDRPDCLMDLATINAREIRKKGLLEDEEVTDEVNACSIEIDVDVDGTDEKWLLMFKNETHNHPTEIEPFGGAATCLGGAIRDPLSGRSYAYQAMRITGSADPRHSFEDTLEGKLPQRLITKGARDGYSSYGNEIGVATGYVEEIYDEGYMAKRMEVGALVSASPKENVTRGQAKPGDLIVLVGGRTGRDGLGGAVGSSQKHTEDSMEDSGAEVQKGNPKVERKILRLFRRKEVAEMIKVCNDFGAGGVSVAIGELADGVRIDLDKVPLKYPGLDGTEIALSESQERMAAVIDREDLDKFLAYSLEEDVEATLVAEVTEEKVLKMLWRGDDIVNIEREFLDTNGIRKKNNVRIEQPKESSFFDNLPENVDGKDIKEDFINNFKDLNIGSQKGLIQSFDESVGRGTVLSQLGGVNRITPAEGMAAKLPVLTGNTKTCSMMTYGFEPKISKWSQFHGGYYAVVESVARIIAMGGSYEMIRLSLQEYFERLGTDPSKWGKTFASLLGAYEAMRELDIPAIGGKDSMSGSFEDLHVPPTLISFAVTTDKVDKILSPEFKSIDSEVGMIKLDMDEDDLLDFDQLRKSYRKIKVEVDKGNIKSASTVKYGGIGRSIGEMALGNGIGFEFKEEENIFKPFIGSIILEIEDGVSGEEIFDGFNYIQLGKTIEEGIINIAGESIELEELISIYEEPLDQVFPIIKPVETDLMEVGEEGEIKETKEKIESPKVLIPVITGSHGEYDLDRAFRDEGCTTEQFVFKTSKRKSLVKSIEDFAEKIKDSHIIALPDGMILGDEPESGGKLYKIIFSNIKLKSAIEEHLAKDRLILGIGAGFETLIKTGLIEYGQVRDWNEDSISITYNENSGFISEFVDIRNISNNSPWLSEEVLGEKVTGVIGSKSARVVGKNLEKLMNNGQVGRVFEDNMTGSDYGVESLISPCGNILGTVSSIERIDQDLFKNISFKGQNRIIKSGVNYFK